MTSRNISTFPYQYQDVANKVRLYIKEQELRLGDRLPSEREFAARFEIGRPTVNKALACLISEGQLRREGYKLYVANLPFREIKPKSIGILCPHPLHRKQRFVSHNLVEAAHDVCDMTRVRFTPMLSVDGSQQYAQLQEVIRSEPDGIVIWPHVGQYFDDLFQQITARNIPLVLSNTHWAQADFVGVDNFSGIQKILDHLAGLGHREVAYLTQPIHEHNLEERAESYLYGVSKYFSETSLRRVWKLPGDGEEGLAELLDKHLHKEPFVTAICCSNDTVALEVIRYCLQQGIDVPEQMSIAGFDGIESGKTSIRPLTSVAQDFYQMGVLAVDLLVRRIHMKYLRQPFRRLQIHVSPSLEIRESTAPCPQNKRRDRQRRRFSNTEPRRMQRKRDSVER